MDAATSSEGAHASLMLLLADNPYADWYLGLSIGFVIVVVVVIVVAVILSYAGKIGDQAGRAIDGLEDVRVRTAPLHEVHNTNKAALAILEAARSARGAVVATVTGVSPPPAAPAASAPAPAAQPAEPPGVLGPESYPSKVGRGPK